MRTIKFRVWDGERMVVPATIANGLNESSLMQFTGLLDKNGKEIYEGDIIEMFISDTSPVPFKVTTSIFFHEGVFCVLKMNEEPLTLREAIIISNKTKKRLEIIGNIYENPDLLTL